MTRARPEQLPSPRERGEGQGERGRRRTLLARSLRSASTDAERSLWFRLRAGRLLGAKFRRQHPVGPYVADFACIEAGLIVELDGSQHLDPLQARRDAERSRYLASRGYSVLRFWNNDVLRRMDAVVERIVRALSPALSPGPSPARGRGELASEVGAPLAPLAGRGVGGEG